MPKFKIIPGKTLIVSDIDGVIADCTTPFIMFVWDRYGVRIEEKDITDFDVASATYPIYMEYTPRPKMPYKNYEEEIIGACWRSPAFFLNLNPYHDMWKLYHNWRAVGGRLVFATSRSERHVEITSGWLSRLALVNRGGIPVFDKDKAKSVETLFQAYKDMQVDTLDGTNNPSFPDDLNVLYFEDDPKNIHLAGERFLGRTDVMIVCIKRPWNADRIFDYKNVIHMATGFNWRQLQEAIDVKMGEADDEPSQE